MRRLCLVALAAGSACLASSASAAAAIPAAARAPIARALERDRAGTQGVFARQATLVVGSGQSYQGYGAVAMSADTIVVGAPGVLYVFVKPSSGWAHATQVAQLTGKRGGIGDGGAPYSRVAISPSGDTIVAGAPGAGGSGRVLVFAKPASGWVNATETAVLTERHPVPGTGLGSSVAISADGKTIAAGADNPSNAHDAGAVYVFLRPPAGWADSRSVARLTDRHGSPNRDLGATVAISANGHVVASSVRQVAVDVFVRPASGWRNQAQTAALTTRRRQAFFYVNQLAMSASGTTIVAGVPGVAPTSAGVVVGALYVFVRAPRGWRNATETAKLTARGGAVAQDGFDFLGSSVVMSASGNVIAASNDVSSQEGAVVYVFVKPRRGWRSATQTGRFATGGEYYDDALAISPGARAIVVDDPDGGRAFVYTVRR